MSYYLENGKVLIWTQKSLNPKPYFSTIALQFLEIFKRVLVLSFKALLVLPGKPSLHPTPFYREVLLALPRSQFRLCVLCSISPSSMNCVVGVEFVVCILQKNVGFMGADTYAILFTSNYFFCQKQNVNQALVGN